MATQLWAIGLIVCASFIGAFGALFFKLGANNLHRQIRLLLKNWNLMIGFGLYGFSTLFFLAGLKGGELSVLYPFVSLTYIWTALVSVRFLGETMNSWKWAGIALILLGVSLIGLGA